MSCYQVEEVAARQRRLSFDQTLADVCIARTCLPLNAVAVCVRGLVLKSLCPPQQAAAERKSPKGGEGAEEGGGEGEGEGEQEEVAPVSWPICLRDARY
eukprot:1981368-Rhodomonas_salina.2